MGIGFSLPRRGFSSSKCKTELKMAVARIKLLRNRREVLVRQMRRDVAMLLQSGQEETARIRVEHVIREQNILAANEIIELFCDLVVARLSIITKQRDCPADLKEGVSSLIYAAPRCSEIPELANIRGVFEKKYGRDFVSAATDLRPDSGVNGLLIEKLSVQKPAGELKLKILKEIAKEHQIAWDTKLTEIELLKLSEEVLEGPCTFVSASTIPLKSTSLPQDMHPENHGIRSLNEQEKWASSFKDSASAARAAVECAEKAAIAAQAAATLAEKKHSLEINDRRSFKNHGASHNKKENISEGLLPSFKNSKPFHFNDPVDSSKTVQEDGGLLGSNARKSGSVIQFDDSDGLSSDGGGGDDEFTLHKAFEGCPSLPPCRPPPEIPPPDYYCSKENSDYQNSTSTLVHPKLPDYDILTARFESLKRRMS